MPRGKYIRNPKPVRHQHVLKPTDKWIISMVESEGNLFMFSSRPTVYTNYDLALAAAEAAAQRTGKPYVVFAKKAVFAPSRPPVTKVEFSA